MTATTVTTDLISANTVSDAESVTGWAQSTDGNYSDGGSPSIEPDFFIQGSNCVSANHTKNGLNTNTLLYNAGSTVTLPTDGAYLIWCFWASPPSLSTYDATPSGGLMTVVASSLGNGALYKASGSNFTPNPIGGWYCYAINPNSHTNDDNFGTAPTGDGQYLGMAVTATRQARGQSFAVDAIRAGRCISEVTGGTSPDTAATFDDISDTLDTNANRYGIFQKVPGGFSWQGKLLLGNGTNEVRFIDSNKNITILNTPKVSTNFNLIEIENGTSVASIVDWTNISFINSGVQNDIANTNSFGNFNMVDSANVIFTSCTFTDMGTFNFDATVEQNILTSTTFRRCDVVTQNEASFINCDFDTTKADVALISTSTTASSIDNCNFIGDNTSHAVNLGTISSSTSINWNSTFDASTYAASSVASGATSTSGDSEVILVNVASGQTLTINVIGSGDLPTYRNTGSGTVNIVVSYTFDVTNIARYSEVQIIRDSDDTIVAGVETIDPPSSVDENNVTTATDPNNTGRFKATYSHDGTDGAVRVVVMGDPVQGDIRYQHLSVDFTLTTQDSSLQVAQIIDRVFDNP